MTARARKKPLLIMPPLHCQIAGCAAEYAAIGDYADTLRAAELGGWRYCIFDDDGERLIGAWACPDHRHVLPWWPGRRIAPPLPVREPGATTAEFLGVVAPAALPAPQPSLPGLGAQGEPVTGNHQPAMNTGQGHAGGDDQRCVVDWGSATPSQRCTRESGHHGVHIDEEGREFGYEPDDEDPWGEADNDNTRAHVMSSSPGRDGDLEPLPPLPQRTPAGPADMPCDFRCGYMSSGQDLADHVRYEHIPCPECGAGEDQDLAVYSLAHKAGCPRLEPGYAYPRDRKQLDAPARPWQAAMDAELSPEALKRGAPLEQLAPEQEGEADV